MPDLALEYLEQSGQSLPPDVQLVLTLERARIRIDLAAQEADDTKRDELTAAAKAGFDEFLRKAPNHPQAAEAAAAVARLYSIQGAAEFAKSSSTRRAAARAADSAKPELAKKAAAESEEARKLFQQATARFAAAAERLDAAANAAPPERKKDLARALLQTKLDAAVNQYRLGIASVEDPRSRAAAIQAAMRGQAADLKQNRPTLAGFDLLSREDESQPVTWEARAWVGECAQQLDDKKLAEDTFKRIAADHRRVNNEASRAGYRLARFFELRAKFDAAATPADNRAVADGADQWLASYRSARPTAETYAVLYFRGRALFDIAMANLAKGREDAEKTKKTFNPTPDLVQQFRVAEGELKKLLTVDNDYLERATQYRNQALRVIIGDAVRPPAQYATFDECHMAAMVQYLKMVEAAPAERAPLVQPTLALLERARQLPVPAESAREAQTSALMLVSTYRVAGRPSEAAVLAEFLMRSSRTPADKAKYGRQALGAYLDSAAKVPQTDATGRRVDEDRVAVIARYLEQQVPTDPVVEEARIIQADQLNRDGKPLEAFEAFARVTPKATRYARARLQQGGLAYLLIRPLPPESTEAKKRPTLPPEKKAELYQRATADLAAVPRPGADTSATEAMVFLRVQLQLAQLHIAAGSPDSCKKAEDVLAALPKFADLKGDDLEIIRLQTELVRIDAVYEQARQLIVGEKFKDAADRLAGLLAEVANAGPAVKEGQSPDVNRLATRLDASRITYVVVPALNARVREGDIAKAAELLDILKKLGGNARRGIAAVFEVVDITRPQIVAMRKAKQEDAANKLNASVAELVGKLASEPGLTEGDKYNLGSAYVKLGEYAKGLALLGQVLKPSPEAFAKWAEPKPKKADDETDETFKKRTDEWTQNWFAVNRFRLAAVDRMQALRLSKDLKGCEALADEVMGPEMPKENAKNKFVRTGPFARQPEFRRELYQLLEAKAEATDPAKATPAWARAIAEWNDFNAEYQRALIQPEPKNEQAAATLRQFKDSIRPLFFDTFAERSRCQVAAFRHVNANRPQQLESGFKNVARNMKKMEQDNPDFPRSVVVKIADLLDANPDLRKIYEAEGGKLFLARPADQQ